MRRDNQDATHLQFALDYINDVIEAPTRRQLPPGALDHGQENIIRAAVNYGRLYGLSTLPEGGVLYYSQYRDTFRQRAIDLHVRLAVLDECFAMGVRSAVQTRQQKAIG
jgi:hypothetical protein